MKIRLSNEIDWAAEFVAHDPHSLESGSRLAWRKFLNDRGIAPGQKLFLHYWNGKEWCSSGQVGLDGKIKLPPTPHTIDRVAKKNRWADLFEALCTSCNYAVQMNGLVDFVSLDEDDIKQCREVRKKHFRVIK